MALMPRATPALLTIAVLATMGLVRDGLHLRDIDAYNGALRAGRHADAARYPGDAGRYAGAYAEYLAGHYQQARQGFSQLEHSDDRALRVAALYNTGNTYLEQAMAIDRVKDADRAIPLIELAKSSYRAALRLAPGHWEARYNLERALHLLPDAYDKRVTDIAGRRDPVRTIVGGDDEAPWP